MIAKICCNLRRSNSHIRERAATNTMGLRKSLMNDTLVSDSADFHPYCINVEDQDVSRTSVRFPEIRFFGTHPPTFQPGPPRTIR